MEDLHNIWNHRWMNPKTEVYDSKINGLGVLAIEEIKKGEVVGVLGGVIVPLSNIKEYHKIMGDVGIQIDDGFFIVPTSREELLKTGVFNHSCNPNIGYSNSITFITIRDIKKGEELTFDYAFSESFTQSFKCNCKSKDCRNIIKPDDWKNPSLQKKYKEYFSPYLKIKFS